MQATPELVAIGVQLSGALLANDEADVFDEPVLRFVERIGGLASSAEPREASDSLPL